jgi:hypothetical protein
MTLLRAGKGIRYALCYSTANQNLTTSTFTALTMDTAVSDEYSWHSSGRITPDADASYLTAGAQCNFDGSGSNYRQFYIGRNGTSNFGSARASQQMRMPAANDFQWNFWTMPFANAVPGTTYYTSVFWHNRGITHPMFGGASTWFSVIDFMSA